MTRTELIDKVAEKTGLTKKDVEATILAAEEEITNALVAGDKVGLSGFGSFEVRKRAARKGKNPQTGAVIDIPAQNSPAFTAGKKLKEAVK